MPLIVTPRHLVHRAQFYRQLSQMTAAGLPIISALNMQLQNPPARSFQEPVRQIIGQLSQGSTIAEALESLGHWMPAFDLALVDAGEKSGRLDAVFRMLADYYDERAVLVRRIISDLLYPVFLLHMVAFIFPFIAWFAGGVSNNQFAFNILKILVPLYVTIFAIVYFSQARRGAAWRSFLERILRPVPVLGAARHFLALARLSAALEALINAGMNIIEAWEMAAAASGSAAMRRTVLAWRPKLDSGQTPAETIRAAPSQFPELFANLYSSGEVSGKLDETLRRLHGYYQDEGTQKLRLIATMVPKAIYFGVAGLIAYKVITFYSGYFEQINQFSK